VIENDKRVVEKRVKKIENLLLWFRNSYLFDCNEGGKSVFVCRLELNKCMLQTKKVGIADC